MKKYNMLGLTALTVFLAAAALLNVLLTYFSDQSYEKMYNVEINRICDALTGSDDYYQIELSGCQYIESTEYLPADTNAEAADDFFQTGRTFLIRPVYQGETLTGYIKFHVITGWLSYVNKVRLAVNCGLGTIIIFLIGVFLYLRKQILAPFREVSQLPLELSKGTLTAPIAESKNRYFGDFIWGLNMLRETLESQRARELELQKEKKTLILSISHDIKTPLSAIKLYTKALKDHLYSDEEKRVEILDKINKQSDDIEGFLSDIIRTSQEDFLDITVPSGEFYLQDLIYKLDDYYTEKLSLLKTDFIIDSFENTMLYGNLDRAVEVLQNIIENAVKYGDGVSISLQFAREENFQLITVKNTGNTLPPVEIVHIFDSFWRGSNTGGQSGSGLGLYICRQILKQMDGEVYAKTDGNRMCVTVVLKML